MTNSLKRFYIDMILFAVFHEDMGTDLNEFFAEACLSQKELRFDASKKRLGVSYRRLKWMAKRH